MLAREICTPQPYTILKEASAKDAAILMAQNNVGTLVVVKETELGNVPIGIITDRDLAINVCVHSVSPETISVGSFMSEFLLSVKGDETIYNVLPKMRDKVVRRVPVVNNQNILLGIISIDDILSFLVDEINDITAIIENEQDLIWEEL